MGGDEHVGGEQTLLPAPRSSRRLLPSLLAGGGDASLVPHSPGPSRSVCHWLLIFIRHCVAGKNTGEIKGGSFLAGIL